MPLILETTKFMVAGHDQPHHDRNNGGHAKVYPKKHYADRTEMPMDEYLALMQLVMLTGEAIMTVMRQRDIDVVRINYQDNGNWGYFPTMSREPHLHIHLYVRSAHEQHPEADPRFRAFPDALVFPFSNDFPEYYKSFKPYSVEDCAAIQAEMDRLLETEKYVGVREKL